MGHTQRIHLGTVRLEWTDWIPWNHLKSDRRATPSAPNPPQQSGVYEVRRRTDGECLDIGRSVNLRRRIRQALVKGTGKHSTGKRIRSSENESDLEVRFALTARPAAVEEALHGIYRRKHGRLPKHVILT